MSTVQLSLDIDRALDSALADVGEAAELRRRVASDPALRRGLQGVIQGPEQPDELDPAAAARRAAAHYLLGRDDEVGRFAARGDSHRLYYLWGMSEIYRDRPLAAVDALRRCVAKEPRDEQARLRLAATLALTGRPDEAKEALGELARQEDRPQVLYVLGTIAEAEGRYGDAQQCYENALVHDAEHVDSLFRLAYQHDLSGDDDAAITLYERARRVRPTRANILLNLGVLYEDRAEFRKAAECYRDLLAHVPDHPRARQFLRDSESSQSMVVDDDMERKEDRRNQLLRTPISDFELSVRSRNCLAKMDISSLGDLIQRTEAELLSYKNFGETSLQEIKDILNAKGLRLGMRRDEVLAAAEAEEETLPLIPDIPLESEDAESLETPVSEMDLSVRSAKAMSLLNIQTIGELLRYSEADLLRIKNFGATSLQELKTKLASMGLSLKKA